MKSFIKVFGAFLFFFSQTAFAGNIIQEFLDKFSKLEYIEYKIIIEENLFSEEPYLTSAICVEKIVDANKLGEFYFNYLSKDYQIIFNGKEYFHYDPESYGGNIVNFLDIKKNPEKFRPDTIMMDGQILLSPPIHETSVYYNNSLMNFVTKLKSINFRKSSCKDSVINGLQAVICRLIQRDTTIKGKREYYIYTFAFDKSTKFPLYYTTEYSYPSLGYYVETPNLSKITYFDYNFDKKDDKKFFSKLAIDKKYKIVENAPYLERKELLKVGEKAPEWKLTSLDNKKFTMTANNDKIRLLAFTKIYCAPCMLSVPKLNELCKEFPEIDVLAIYPVDEKQALENYRKNKKIEYPILPTDTTVSDKYNITGHPAFYLVDKSGIIQFVQSGYGEGSKENFKAAIEKILGK